MSDDDKPKRPALLSAFSSTASLAKSTRSFRSTSSLRFRRRRPQMNLPSFPSGDVISASASVPSTPQSNDDNDEYVNPLEIGPRWMLTTRAVAIRTAASIGSSVFGWLYQPTRVIWLDACALLANERGPLSTAKIQVDIWEPMADLVSTELNKSRRRPAIINFHGGGFFLGLGTDDAWWTTLAAQELGAVVFSVGYRLAPANPFPVPVEDCADAILQITARADEFGIDPANVVLSGFSAGGNLCLSSWIILQQPTHWGYIIPNKINVPTIAGMAIFYPVLDQTISRPQKRSTCSQPDMTLPPFLTNIIDASYIYPQLSTEQRADLRLSPGLMEDSMLKSVPMVHLCLCEHDMLTEEGKIFGERLRANGRLAEMRIVSGEKHAFDKPPPMTLKQSANIEYHAAITSLRAALRPPHIAATTV